MNDQIKADAGKAYSVWNKAGAWVAANPKSAITIAIAVVVAVLVVAF